MNESMNFAQWCTSISPRKEPEPHHFPSGAAAASNAAAPALGRQNDPAPDQDSGSGSFPYFTYSAQFIN
jgi:hypothetical protein